MELVKRREKNTKKEELLEEINRLKKELTIERKQVEGKTEENKEENSLQNNEPIIGVKTRQIPSEGFNWAVNRERYPWMYSIPVKTADFEDWLNQWSDFTLQWFKINKLHKISLVELMNENPFRYLQNKSKALTLILENLINRKFCEYTDKERKSVRVFWRSYKDWSEIIYKWALKKGVTELTLFELIDLEESPDNFHMLPKEDYKKIFHILVKNKRAKWISKKNKYIRLLF